jgi:hypothetical protein
MRIRISILLFVLASLAAAAGIDGKWVADMKMPAGKKGGEARTAQLTLDLKAEGSKLTGTVNVPAKRRGGSVAIQDGKIEGNQFSFTTVQTSKKKGDQKVEWKGTLEGDQLQGTRSSGKRGRGAPFTAKRA